MQTLFTSNDVGERPQVPRALLFLIGVIWSVIAVLEYEHRHEMSRVLLHALFAVGSMLNASTLPIAPVAVISALAIAGGAEFMLGGALYGWLCLASAALGVVLLLVKRRRVTHAG